MKCWNCQQVLPVDNFAEICPHCRVARRPASGSRSELIGAVVALVGAGAGYAIAGWTGVVFGLSAGVPLGFLAAVLWSQPPTVG